MSTMDRDDDDEFPGEEEILAGFESQFEGIADPDVPNVKTMSEVELSAYFNSVRDELIKIGEMQEVKTDHGRELHSIRSACLIEMSERNMR